MHVIGIHIEHLFELIPDLILGLGDHGPRPFQLLDIGINLQQLIPERHMIPRALFQHLLKEHNQVIVIKELVDVDGLVGDVLGVVLDHFAFDEIGLVVVVETIHEVVFFEGAFEGVDCLETVLLAVLEDEGQEQVDFLGVVETVQVLLEDINDE